ncbi:MAG TPA: hypothetical protein VIK60_02220 [Vicinamibacterales bacterium]
MMLTIAVLLTLTVAGIIRRVRVPGGVNARQLGWMSEQWLTEHRASHLK